jgi:hypothetical protein
MTRFEGVEEGTVQALEAQIEALEVHQKLLMRALESAVETLTAVNASSKIQWEKVLEILRRP